MKKILMSLVVIALAVAAVSGGTFALYNDTETSSGNTFAATTLDLKVDINPAHDGTTWANSPLGALTDLLAGAVSNMKPGDSMSNNIGVLNSINSGISGVPTFKLTNLVDDENVIVEPEIDADTNTWGDLSRNVKVVISYHDYVTTTATEEYNGTLYDLKNQLLTATGWVLSPGQEGSWDYTISIDSGVGNIIQSDKVTFDLVFGLTQVTE